MALDSGGGCRLTQGGLAVITVNWGDPVHTLRAVSSLLGGGTAPEMVYIVDNGSCESDLMALREGLLGEPRCTLVERQANGGFAVAVNEAARLAIAAGYEALVVMNNDVEVAEDAIANLLVNWQPEVEVRSPVIWYGSGPQRRIWWAGGRVSAISGRVVHEGLDNRSFVDRGIVRNVGFVSGCIFLTSASVWQRLQGLAEDYFLYWEDVEFSYRAGAAGVALQCVEAAHVYHAVGASSGGGTGGSYDSPLASYYSARNRWLFLRRNGTSASLVLNGFLTFPRVIRMWFRTRGSDATARRCFAAALSGTAAGIRGEFNLRPRF